MESKWDPMEKWEHEREIFEQKKNRIKICSKVYIICGLIVLIFAAALIALAKTTENCYGDIENNGFRCAGKISTSTKAPKVTCDDPHNFNCHYMTAAEDFHVHVLLKFTLCGRYFNFVQSVQMYDADSFLHFKDDRLMNCRKTDEPFLMNCHHRGEGLIEGFNEADEPDLYFIIDINCTEIRQDCYFTLNTKPLGILTPNMRNKKCHLEGPLYTFWHVPEFYSPEVGSVGFPETSQLYNWLVWKCTATVDLGIFFNQTCDLNALPDNLNRNLNDASKQKFDALLVAVFILIIIMCFV
ncbi:uncharacterized protein LOC142350282 [Convolutriloba macropyga]|uniref:uncharacterized protein LOC142350282 n=1 Tax=Convolutriloba macropyga TaxID=536237 RepID=UPI003F51BF39